MKVRNVDKINFDNDLPKEKKVETENSILNTITSKFEKIWFYSTLLLTGLLLIFALMTIWMQQEHAKSEKNYQREIQLKEIQNTLSTAVIEANRGDFEVSRQTANDFFALLEKEMVLENDSVFNPDQRQVIIGLLGNKSIINQMLANKNPQVRDELGKVYETYQKSVQSFQPIQKTGVIGNAQQSNHQ